MLSYEAIRRAIITAARRLLGRLGAEGASLALALPDMVCLIQRLVADPRVPTAMRAELTTCILYLISPIDFLPEMILGPVGLLDDLAVFIRILDLCTNRVDQELVVEHWPGRRRDLDRVKRFAGLGLKAVVRNAVGGVRTWVSRRVLPWRAAN